MSWVRENTHKVAFLAALLVGIAGVCVLLGWHFRIPALKGESFGTFVAPATGLLFLVCAASVIFQISRWRGLHRTGVVLGIFVFASGAAVLVEHIFNVNLGIDGLIMSHRLDDWTVPSQPGRFSITTAASFVFAGLSLATLRLSSRWPASDVFASMVALVSYLGLVGYFFNTSVLFGRVTAVPTIVLFMVLSLALWCSSKEHLLLNLVTSEFAGGIVARRFTILVLTLLPILGLLEIRGREAEVFDRGLGIALLVVVTASIIIAIALHTASVLNDVDRRRLQAEAVLIQTEKLAAAGRMAATIAHEINNPLSAITNLLYLSRLPNVDAASRESFLEKAEDELNRVALIAKQTLGFYRETSSATAVDPKKIVTEVLDLYRSRLTNRGIRIVQESNSHDSVVVSVGEFRQVIANLVGNSIDACPQKDGVIRIRVLTHRGHVLIEVNDNGSGIRKEDQSRVFEAFFTTKKDFGTGLGLWVSKELVEKNGGQLSLLSNGTGSGATFTVSFPAHRPVAVAATNRSNNVT
jgi:signal transduction histidine kinase